MTLNLKAKLLASLPRELLLDLADMAIARAFAAHELVREHTDLKGRSARGLEGQARFRLLERGFEDVCELHGGVAIGGGVMPGTDLRFYQPFMRFGGGEPGVVLALASMPYAKELPVKNQSRLAGISLNRFLTPQLDFGEASPKPGDVFVLFLVARDPARAGKIEEMALGVIDAEYKAYLSYEVVEDFLTGYTTPDGPDGDDGGPSGGEGTLVRLKAKRGQYRPAEEEVVESDAESGE